MGGDILAEFKVDAANNVLDLKGGILGMGVVLYAHLALGTLDWQGVIRPLLPYGIMLASKMGVAISLGSGQSPWFAFSMATNHLGVILNSVAHEK